MTHGHWTPTSTPSDSPSDRPVAVVTGASSGIGRATAIALAADGYRVVAGARRLDRLDELAAEHPGIVPIALDVTDQASVDALAASVDRVDVLVNNAGGAHGVSSIAEADLEAWQWMYDVNVLGTLRVTKALLPRLIDSGNGLVVVVSSIAGHESYKGGGGYNAAKHAESSLSRVLRIELLGEPVRVSEVCPGLVETEFSLVRFQGDAERAAEVYAGTTPLRAVDIAETIRWIASAPSHVNIDSITVLARDQISATVVNRTTR